MILIDVSISMTCLSDHLHRSLTQWDLSCHDVDIMIPFCEMLDSKLFLHLKNPNPKAPDLSHCWFILCPKTGSEGEPNFRYVKERIV
jgi:hypothetical protein